MPSVPCLIGFADLTAGAIWISELYNLCAGPEIDLSVRWVELKSAPTCTWLASFHFNLSKTLDLQNALGE